MSMSECVRAFGSFLGMIWDFLCEIEIPVIGCSAAGLMVGVFLVEASIKIIKMSLGGGQGGGDSK